MFEALVAIAVLGSMCIAFVVVCLWAMFECLTAPFDVDESDQG